MGKMIPNTVRNPRDSTLGGSAQPYSYGYRSGFPRNGVENRGWVYNKQQLRVETDRSREIGELRRE